MAENIESFVAKLQAEGVEAGQKEAQKIKEQAENEAAEIVAQAKAQAEQILAKAQQERESLLEKTQTELKLAARDTALRLREALNRALEAVLHQAVKKQLSDPEFLGKLLHDLVMLYARSDIAQGRTLEINVEPEVREKLIDWAIKVIGDEALESIHPSIDLKGTLKEAGFEYRIGQATIEVTEAAVVEALASLIRPQLAEMLRETMGQETQQASSSEQG